jgi:hypothetical protein
LGPDFSGRVEGLELAFVQSYPFGIVALALCVRGGEALWRVIVDTKYGSSWGGWCSNEVHGSYGMELQKNIMREWCEFFEHIKVEVRDDSKI